MKHSEIVPLLEHAKTLCGCADGIVRYHEDEIGPCEYCEKADEVIEALKGSKVYDCYMDDDDAVCSPIQILQGKLHLDSVFTEKRQMFCSYTKPITIAVYKGEL